MRVLIIGNGFDLAHNLNTRYADFLEICSYSRKAQIEWQDNKIIITSRELKNSFTKEQIYFFINNLGEKRWQDFKKFAGCYWIEHFQEKRKYIGDTWLDFEEEIKKVLDLLIVDMAGDHDRLVSVENLKDITLIKYCKNRRYDKNPITYRALFLKLKEEHIKLVQALNLYFYGYINVINKSATPLSIIKKKQFDKVVSFNYSNTYKTIYNEDVDCCYIHGTAGANRNTVNLVFGFDDHYIDGTKLIPEIIPFEKYYQRIINNNDNQYFQWLEAMDKEKNNEIFIYGHSLAPSDGDILRSFLLKEHVMTTIFYYNELDRAEKVRNLAVVLGPDNLIKFTGGVNPAICFKNKW